ncbi:cation transporter [Arthrobacter gandavensis]|uniref:cation transporter n=1 Tax=Arthrobacter gandavensis TaxID=169960 RepID=UPI00188E49E7|nr:cation transporter [Arthrobacter gandavensis]MBF4995313.1 cation transporter [Arthrobacter gandavensis]
MPADVARILRRAIRLEWATMGVLALSVTIIFLVLGNSQAMKTAWIEDMLSFIPPITFLVGIRVAGKPATRERPFGHHRAIGISHLVAATALAGMGCYLIIDSGLKLVTAEHPTIGGITLFGHTLWLGWLMIAAMILTSIPPVILGRMKLKLAAPLHNKVLFADADMNKADWMTGAAVIIGVTGIGLGLWWADAAAALVVALSILRDGLVNVRSAVRGLLDARATTYNDTEPHPLLKATQDYLDSLDWIKDAGVRMRDEGQVFHVEAFIVPRAPNRIRLHNLAQARTGIKNLDWKIRDVTIVPVHQIPDVTRA